MSHAGKQGKEPGEMVLKWCEKHSAWYVPHRVPCSGCRKEADVHWMWGGDYDIQTLLGLKGQ